MILTKLIYPKYYRVIYTDKSHSEIDYKKMRELNYTEDAISYYEQAYWGSGYTEEIDLTINRWLKENEDKVTLIDIKYQGVQDDNNNVSALLIYKEDAWE